MVNQSFLALLTGFKKSAVLTTLTATHLDNIKEDNIEDGNKQRQFSRLLTVVRLPH